MRLAIRRAVLAALVVFSGGAIGAEQTSTIDIVTYGGLLGRIEGFFELPPGGGVVMRGRDGQAGLRGGVQGVMTTLEGLGLPASTFRIMTGDNLPADFDPDCSGFAGRTSNCGSSTSPATSARTHPFWDHLARTAPQIVAIGDEDVLRGLTSASAGVLREWANGMFNPVPDGPRFLASNIAVRLHATGLNTVEHPGAVLALAPDESVGWVDELTIEHSSQDPGALTYALGRGAECPSSPAAAPQCEPSPQTTVEADAAGIYHSTVTLHEPLRPGIRYHLTLRKSGVRDRTFVFETDHTFTDGSLPVARVARGSQAVVVVAMVSPDLTKLIHEDRLKWTPAEAACASAQAGRTVDACVLDFLDPLDVAENAVKWTKPASGPQDPLVLVSSLEDSPTLDLLGTVPEFRFVVLHPETHVLARAARRITKPRAARQSGDRGFAGVIDSQFVGATKAVLRPEWFGETIQYVTATIDRSHAFTQLADVRPRTVVVHGMPLCWQGVPNTTPPRVQYSVRQGNGSPLHLPGTYELYPPADPSIAFEPGVPQRNLWTSVPELLSLFLDTARRQVHAEIAVLPLVFVDEDVVARFALYAETARLDWLSEYVLHQAVYRPERVMRIRFKGDELAAWLEKTFKAEEYCAAGLGLPCPVKRFEAKHLRVNGRPLLPGHQYYVAIPESLAIAQGIDPTDGHDDILHAVSDRFVYPSGLPPIASACEDQASRIPPPTPAKDTLARYLEGTRRNFLFVHGDPFGVEITKVDASQSAIDGPFSAIPLIGRSVKPLEERKADLKLDVGYVFNPRYAVRAQSSIKFTRTRIEDEVTLTDDEWRYGARFDVRNGALTYFGGLFYQRQLEDEKSKKFEPTRPFVDRITMLALDGVTEAGPKVTEVRPAIRYRYLAFGVELPTYRRGWFSAEKSVLEVDWGGFNDVPLAPRLEGEPLRLEDYLRLGPQKLLNDLYKNQSPLIREGARLTFDTDRDDVEDDFAEARLVLAGSAKMKPGTGFKGGELDVTTEARWFPTDLPSGLLPRASIELKTKALWPAGRSLKVGPFLDSYFAVANETAWFRTYRYGLRVEYPLFWKW